MTIVEFLRTTVEGFGGVGATQILDGTRVVVPGLVDGADDGLVLRGFAKAFG
jgi:hypothetical protein